jgi:vanillate O-demethylase monooxygenase subunit
MFIRDCWYVIAWSHEVGQDQLFTRTVLNEPILVYRTADGKPVAMDNRCCHRLAPLSAGRKEGDCVRCGYHGLKFDARGQCIEVPGQDRIPPAARLRTYPIAEKNRWLFVWMGKPEAADPALLPDNFSNDSPDWRNLPGYKKFDTNWLLICDNLLDFAHLTYVHEKTLGGSPAIAHSRADIEKLERGIRVTRRIANTVPAPYHRKFGKFDGEVDRWFIYDFLVPGTLLMSSGVKPPGRANDDHEGALRLHSCQTITPETDRSTHYFYQQSHGFALDDSSVTESIFRSLDTAFDEDRAMISGQQAMIDLDPSMRMVPIGSDAALVQYRALVERMLGAAR